MSENGCGITAISIILSGYNKDYTPEDLRKKYSPVLNSDDISKELSNTFKIKNSNLTINISKNLIYKNIVLNTENYEVFIDNKKVELTIREFDILRTLTENANKVFSRNELLDLVWGYDYYGDSNIVNTHIKNIRQKIGNQYITTVRGIGYKI